MRSRLLGFVRAFRMILLRGTRFHCPICDRSFRRFLPMGPRKRPNALCPCCGSLERHRLLRVALDHLAHRRLLRLEGTLLHMAPEGAMVPWLKQKFLYVSGDLDPRQAMVSMDITRLPLRTGSMDAVLCLHVLEHIPDDRAALAELHRVLKPGGWGSIQVPMQGERTQEDPAVTDPRERERRYGQADHVRYYGRDFLQRLEAAGFQCRVFPKEELLGAEALDRLSVACESEVVVVFKPLLPVPPGAPHGA
jgi:SAM-dependent methyltransferase